jgi:exopolyphosphatase/guanosine-5'-triphosphate,3'-diphosphate pyrophosphatase
MAAPAPVRVAVVDLGTNSTRLLLAEVAGGEVRELDRRTTITRLGQDVDASGRLADEAVARVVDVLAGFEPAIAALRPERTAVVATSAVRDAANGAEFRALLHDRFGLDARTITGDEEARLTFLGATARRPRDDGTTLVIDIGGGSTELVIGRPGEAPSFAVSTRAGAVRQTERHLGTEPPDPHGLSALATEVRGIVEQDVPAPLRAEATTAVAVAGTATALAAVEQELEPYDASRVDGYTLELGACERMLSMLAAHDLEARRRVPGLDPARAPTIVAGTVILVEVLRAFGLAAAETSEADILHGAALTAAGAA